MDELSRVGELDPAAEYARTHQTARRIGVEALERELHGETTDVVDISLYVRGRMIATHTDSATVARIMAILTGTAD
jgi:hypothetical protein